MAGLSAPGVGSGLDVNNLITQLMAVERRPLARFQADQAQLQTRISALGQFRASVSSIQDAAAALGRVNFQAMSLSSSTATVATASANGRSQAAVGFGVEVTQLARNERLAAPAQTSSSAVIGTGALVFSFGDTTNIYDATTGAPQAGSFTPNPDAPSRTVNILPGQESLSGIRDAVNAANIGVTASIVNDSSGARLVFSGTRSGQELGIQVTGSGDLESFAQSFSRIEQGRDAIARVDGLEVRSTSNTFANVVDGVDLTVLAEGSTRISGQRDVSAARNALNGLVSSYNALLAFANEVSANRPGDAPDGPLANDATVRGVLSRVRAEINREVPFLTGDIRSLNSLGVAFQRDGTLGFDATRFDAALARDPAAVERVFRDGGSSTNALARVAASTTSSRVGRFDLEVLTPATRGLLVGQDQGATTTADIDSSNNAFTIRVNGVEASITLDSGVGRTFASIATELQDRLNATSAFGDAGVRVEVEFTGGAFNIRSAQFGSSSIVEAPSGSAATLLIGTPQSNTAGADVQVRLGGETLTGTGRRVTRDDGLALDIEAESSGPLGAIEFSRGLGRLIGDAIGALSGTSGLVQGRIDGLGQTITRIQGDQARFERRLEQIEARYRRQFAALDSMVASLNTTSQFLAQQLSALNPNRGG